MTQVAEPEAKRWVGGGILRKEDPELLTGQGRYVDDIALPGMLHGKILRFNPDGLEETENIYLNAGVGVTFSLADRYTVSVAAENLAYRYNTGRAFLSQDELDEIGLTLDNFNQQTVYNPAVSASLKFYLGGRDEGQLTDVDRALMRQFRGGGFRLAPAEVVTWLHGHRFEAQPSRAEA